MGNTPAISGMIEALEQMIFEAQYAPLGERTKARKKLAKELAQAISTGYKEHILNKEK